MHGCMWIAIRLHGTVYVAVNQINCSWNDKWSMNIVHVIDITSIL